MRIGDPDLNKMTVEERSRYFDEKIRWVVKYAYDNAPAMRKKMDEAGVAPDQIKRAKDLEMIPVTKKDDLIALQAEDPPFGGLLGVSPQEVREIFVSPGPIYDPFGDEVYSRTARILEDLGFGLGDIVINTFSYHLVPAGLYYHQALAGLGIKVVPTGVGNSELQLQVMRQLKATGYVGTPSFLMTLIKKAERLGYDFCRDFSLRKAHLASEMLPQSMRDVFEQEYRIEVSQAYGSADMGITAYECAERSGLHIAEEFFMEIVDPSTGRQLGPGEIGEVVVTPFERTRPLIRFGTGDLSVYTAEPCRCGRTSPRLLRILGRVGEAVKVRAMFVHPRELSEAVGHFREVENYQAVVQRIGVRDHVTLKVELRGRTGIDEENLKERILRHVADSCRVTFDHLEFVPVGTLPHDGSKIIDERTWD